MKPHVWTLVVLDDDPTGIQTVHGCLVLTRWDEDTLAEALRDPAGFFYILSNTRALPARQARALASEIAACVLSAADKAGRSLVFYSRSDSTLRGHFPLEIDAVREVTERHASRPVDAVFLAPAFIEGGRITQDDTHYVVRDGIRIESSSTEFARDSVFGYSTSYLPAYVEEKTVGRVSAQTVRSIPADLLNGRSDAELSEVIGNLSGGVYVVVNARGYDELDRFAAAVRRAMNDGKRFLFHGGASLVRVLAGQSAHPLLDHRDLRDGKGLIVVGSHVGTTSRQLECLRENDGTRGFELDVSQTLADPRAATRRALDNVAQTWSVERTPVVFTSRTELAFDSHEKRQSAGMQIAAVLADIVRHCAPRAAWVIAKGGITAHTVLADGLGYPVSRVLGQVAPGVPVVKSARDADGNTPLCVIFPGNVGEQTTLRDVWNMCKGE